LDTVEKTSSSADMPDSISSANLQRISEQISTAAISDKNSHSTPSLSPGENFGHLEGCKAGDALCSQYKGSNGGWAAIVEAKVALDRAEAAAAALQNQIGQAFRAFSKHSTSDK
jgi:hypothetical protein